MQRSGEVNDNDRGAVQSSAAVDLPGGAFRCSTAMQDEASWQHQSGGRGMPNYQSVS